MNSPRAGKVLETEKSRQDQQNANKGLQLQSY
jgi:hypothetical protein